MTDNKSSPGERELFFIKCWAITAKNNVSSGMPQSIITGVLYYQPIPSVNGARITRPLKHRLTEWTPPGIVRRVEKKIAPAYCHIEFSGTVDHPALDQLKKLFGKTKSLPVAIPEAGCEYRIPPQIIKIGKQLLRDLQDELR